MATYDVIVVGLGGMGSAAAYHLAARGQRVLGLDKFEPAHNLGSSHGGSRIIRQSYFEDPAYVPLLLRAYELWEAAERDSGASLLTVTGGLMIGPPESLTVSGSQRSAQEWGLPHEMLDATEIRRRYPTLTPTDGEVALYETKAGFVRPEATVSAHIKLAAQHGAELHFSEPVQRWTALPGGGVQVLTGAGMYTADRLVICPGAWAPQLLADLGVPFTVERQVQFWFEPTGGVEPFLPDRHPIYIWEDEDSVQVYGFPAHDGPDGGAKVAFFRRGQECTPETIDRTVADEEVTTIADHLASHIPTLPGRFLRAATCLYTNTPDEHFVIAVHPDHPQVTVACGFSGHGFKFVPVVGEIVADLATTGTTQHPIALFDPRRLTGEETSDKLHVMEMPS
jgi:sarcosine oxidase